MRRIQLYMDEDLDDALSLQARQQGVAKAVLIRQYLRHHVRPPENEDDPSDHLIGSYEGDPTGSTSVNDVLYGA